MARSEDSRDPRPRHQRDPFTFGGENAYRAPWLAIWRGRLAGAGRRLAVVLLVSAVMAAVVLWVLTRPERTRDKPVPSSSRSATGKAKPAPLADGAVRMMRCTVNGTVLYTDDPARCKGAPIEPVTVLPSKGMVGSD